MTNSNTPYGLIPVKNSPFVEIPKNYYYIPASYATALFIGSSIESTTISA